MRCSVCGKEFGTGCNCQHCGVDRVTGLANYGGYNPSTGSNSDRSDKYQQYGSSSNGGCNSFNTMICYACEEIIPANSEYCPHCRKKLFETCPKCGNKFSSQYYNCNQCGTNLKQYLKEEKEREWKRTEEAIKVQLKEQHQREAQQIKNELTPSFTIIYAPLAIVLLLLLFITNRLPDFVLIISPVLILIWCSIAMVVCTSIRNSRIEKWKQEHPNDPRSKYL